MTLLPVQSVQLRVQWHTSRVCELTVEGTELWKYQETYLHICITITFSDIINYYSGTSEVRNPREMEVPVTLKFL